MKHVIMESVIMFLACAAPGFCAGYALAAINHNRRITRKNRIRLPYSVQKL